jgi:hypothetical protein
MEPYSLEDYKLIAIDQYLVPTRRLPIVFEVNHSLNEHARWNEEEWQFFVFQPLMAASGWMNLDRLGLLLLHLMYYKFTIYFSPPVAEAINRFSRFKIRQPIDVVYLRETLDEYFGALLKLARPIEFKKSSDFTSINENDQPHMGLLNNCSKCTESTACSKCISEGKPFSTKANLGTKIPVSPWKTECRYWREEIRQLVDADAIPLEKPSPKTAKQIKQHRQYVEHFAARPDNHWADQLRTDEVNFQRKLSRQVADHDYRADLPPPGCPASQPRLYTDMSGDPK